MFLIFKFYFQEQIYTYMILYTQCFSTQKLQCKIYIIGVVLYLFEVRFSGFVTRLSRRVPLVEQELLTIPEHLSSPPIFSGVRVTRSLVLYVCFADRCFSFCTFSFGHCVVCSSSIYGF